MSQTRANIVFSLLLTIVAFNYTVADNIPKVSLIIILVKATWLLQLWTVVQVSYSTVLISYVNACFLVIIFAGGFSFWLTWAAHTYTSVYRKFPITTVIRNSTNISQIE